MKDKDKFILTEIWSLTISAAFQRANVYAEGSIDENLRNDFKKELQNQQKNWDDEKNKLKDEIGRLENLPKKDRRYIPVSIIGIKNSLALGFR